MPVAQCVQILKRQCRVIKTVQAMYSEAVSVSATKKLALFLPSKLLDVFNNNSGTEHCIVGNVTTKKLCLLLSNATQHVFIIFDTLHFLKLVIEKPASF